MRKLVFCFFACGLIGQAAQPGAIEYGKYLVEHVANCGRCHKLPGVSGDSAAQSPAAPDLRPSGKLFTQWGERGMVQFLETGINPQGHSAPSHMPAFKLRPHDAHAIVAYLKTLK